MLYKFGSHRTDLIWLRNGWCENSSSGKQVIQPISYIGINCWGGETSLTATSEQLQVRRETDGPKTSTMPQRLCRVTRMMEESCLLNSWSRTEGCRTKQVYLQYYSVTASKTKKSKKGVSDHPVLSFSSIEQFVSFKRHLLAFRSSLKYIVVKWVPINNRIAGIDYF